VQKLIFSPNLDRLGQRNQFDEIFNEKTISYLPYKKGHPNQYLMGNIIVIDPIWIFRSTRQIWKDYI